jgi:hypothetical protein
MMARVTLRLRAATAVSLRRLFRCLFDSDKSDGNSPYNKNFASKLDSIYMLLGKIETIGEAAMYYLIGLERATSSSVQDS